MPDAQTGSVTVRAMAADPLGTVQPIAVALTNGRSDGIRVDPRQAYASGAGGERIAPLQPGEAARVAGGRRLPGALRSGAKGAAAGSLFGAIGGAISGAIQGGIGTAVGIGAAVGAAVGAIGGVISGGGEPAPDVAGFAERGLQATTLAPGLSTTGYLYYPTGTYETLELLLIDASGGVTPERTSIAPAE